MANTYISRSDSSNNDQKENFEEKILNKKLGDNRQKNPWNFTGAGQLRMLFKAAAANGKDPVYVGTAFPIYAKFLQKDSWKIWLLTCAHNVVDIDPFTKAEKYAEAVWFEANYGRHRIDVTDVDVHPKYFVNPTSTSGYDLAVLSFRHSTPDLGKSDGVINCLKDVINDLPWWWVSGYPASKKGVFYGASSDDKNKLIVEDEMIIYQDIDTSGGQSGSPIYFGHDFMDIIVGVHTGGSCVYGKNWGTRLTKQKIQWIQKCVGENDFDKRQEGTEETYQFMKNGLSCFKNQ